tara:strand:- start:24 stop:284 length:261 start_codon:yes stop_codon:yes gene_type:complete
MREFWKIWKYALGSFHDETTKNYDDIICVIRSFIFLQLVITNCFIIAGNIRHWNKNNESTMHSMQHSNTEHRKAPDMWMQQPNGSR